MRRAVIEGVRSMLASGPPLKSPSFFHTRVNASHDGCPTGIEFPMTAFVLVAPTSDGRSASCDWMCAFCCKRLAAFSLPMDARRTL